MEQKNTGPYFGSCLCDGVQYQVDHIEPDLGHCHCTMCRKFHGASFATLGEAKADNFTWIKGEGLLESYKAENGTIRQFCRRCGSSMTFSVSNNEEGLVEFALGTLDSDIPNLPDAHIFLDFAANWSCLNDELPKYREGRSGSRKD
jgi:hypothetical protein